MEIQDNEFNNNITSNNLVPKEVKKYKAENNWMEILKFYDARYSTKLQYCEGDLPRNISLAEKNEILFAAWHLCDDFDTQRKNLNGNQSFACKTFYAYLWAYDITIQNYKENPSYIPILKTYAYYNYALYIQLGYDLGKLHRKFNINDAKSTKKLSKIRKSCFEDAFNSHFFLIKNCPSDIKILYRFAHLVSQYLISNAHKETETTNNYNYYRLCYKACNLVFEICEDGMQVPKGNEKEFCKTLYTFTRLITWACDNSFVWEKMLPNFLENKKTYAKIPNKHGIKWTCQDLKLAEKCIKIYFLRVGYPVEDFCDEIIYNVASEKYPITTPIYPFYQLAKLHYVMAMVYTSGVEPFWKIRINAPEKIRIGYIEHLDKAILFCSASIDVRAQRKKLGFTDVDGAAANHSLTLLMKLYTMHPNTNINTIKDWANRNKWNEEIQYYYGIYLIYNKRHNKFDEGVEILKNIIKKSKNKILVNKCIKELEFYNIAL